MSKRDTTTLPHKGAPFVDPRVDPSVSAYAAGIAARRGGTLPKQQMPLNQERPPIPNLTGMPDASHQGGQTMADYARAERRNARLDESIDQVMGPGSIIEEGVPAVAAPRPRAPTAASLGLAPADTLTDQAKQDPEFISGPGSEYASNQPGLAARYGVLRNAKFIPPQKLGGGERRISPATLQDLETIKNLQQVKDAPPEEPIEGLGHSAAKVGNLPGDNAVDAPTEDQKTEALRSAIQQMDAFEFNQWRQLMMRDILHSDDQRVLIESRLQPMKVEDLIMQGVVRQKIPIIPGKYEVTLQSHDGQMELAIKRLVMSESRSVDVGEQYYLDKHSFMSLAVGLHKINDKTFPDVLDKDGLFDDKMFFTKFNQIMKLPIHMLASIGVNQMWFEIRVRKLFKAEQVGNG